MVQVLVAYVTLLKAISMKLTPGLVCLFFHTDKDGAASFPLYTEAVKFIAHRHESKLDAASAQRGIVSAGARNLLRKQRTSRMRMFR